MKNEEVELYSFPHYFFEYYYMTSYKEIYKLPLELHKRLPRAICSNGLKAFDFLYQFDNFQEIIDIINGDKKSNLSDKNITYYCCEIFIDNRKVIRLRGWGDLTGINGKFKMSSKDAIKIQDEFGEYIVNKLKNR